MAQKLSELLKVIHQVFNETMTTEFKQNKIWWTEGDLIGAFYYKLRPKIDIIANHGICWEWRIYEGTKRDPKVDLVIVEYSVPSDKRIEASPLIAMEFKWGQKEKKEEIEKDARKLTRMISEKCKDSDLDLGDKIKRINKGDKPNQVILFIADASYKVDRDEMRRFYEGLKPKYPKIEIIYDFPLNQKLKYFE